MKTYSNLSVLCLLILLPFWSACQQDDDQPSPGPVSTTAELTAALENILLQNEAPGFALSIVSDDAVVYQQAFGYAEVASQQVYTNQSMQHLASVSKTFVGAATAKAISLGLFDLETDINEILPVELVNPKQPNATIRVKHLVSHTSGLLDVPNIYFASNYSILPGEDLTTTGARALTDQLGIQQRPSRSLENYLAEYFLEDGALYSLDNFAASVPGSNWAYSNMATGLMAYVIEQAAGQPFHEFVREQILEPLGMVNSTYQQQEIDRDQLTHWYLDSNTPLPYYTNDSYAEGSLFTSNEEVGNYLLNMVRGSQAQANELFPTTYYELLFADQLSPGIVPADFAENHGLFWIKNGGKYQHGGNSFGVSAYLEVDPSKAQGYSFMTNLDATFNYQPYNSLASAINEVVTEFLAVN